MARANLETLNSRVLTNWAKNPRTTLMTLLVLSFSYFVAATLILFAQNLQLVMTSWGDAAYIAFYLSDEATAAEASELQDSLAKEANVLNVQMVSKIEAAATFREQMASYAPDLLNDNEFGSPFPASLKVQLKKEMSAEDREIALKELAEKYSKKDSVEDVSYGQSWLKNYVSLIRFLSQSGMSVLLALLFGTVLVIGNTLRASVDSRREEIEILELIGASKQLIRKPFLFEGVITSLLASFIALIMSAGMYHLVVQQVRASLTFSRLTESIHFFNGLQLSSYMLAAIGIGFLGSWFVLRSINTGWAAEKSRER